MHHGHAFLIQQVRDEVFVGGDELAVLRLLAQGLRAVGIDIEGALGHRALDIFRLVQHGDHEVPALLEGVAEDRQMVLRAVEGLHGGPLGDSAGARGLLALQQVKRLDEGIGTRRIADAPAGHGVALRHAVEGEGAVHQTGLDLADRGELEVPIGQMFVDVVSEHPDMPVGGAHQDIGDRLQLVAGIGGAGGVGGGVQQQPLGARGDGALQILRLDLETVLQGGGHDHRLAVGDDDHVGVADPVGRGNDDLIALVAGGEEGVEQDLLAAGAHDGLAGLVVQVVLALELGRDGLAQGHDAQHGRIFGLAATDGVDSGFLDVVGRIEVGLADRERDDVAPAVFQIARTLGRHHGGGRLDAGYGSGEERHGHGSGKADFAART